MIDRHNPPPLNALRVFEAVARHLSFTNAARELHITQAAVSHQIKSLEEQLGTELFLRVKRRVLLSESGQILLPAVVSAFTGISNALEAVQEQDAEQTLSVSVTPQFASNWLAHRIGTFYKRYPEINLHLQISIQEPDFLHGKTDLGVYWGNGKWNSLESELLIMLEYTPVCNPELLTRQTPLSTPADLANFSLLHEYGYGMWKDWLLKAGVPAVKYKRGSIFEDTNLLIHAAIDGKGVALCGLEMVQEHLEAGRLVRLFDCSLKSESGYFVVFPEEALQKPVVVLFKEWLMEETRRTCFLNKTTAASVAV